MIQNFLNQSKSLQPSNTDAQVKLEEIAGEKFQFVSQMCQHMFDLGNQLDKKQSRIYQLTCVGPKFESEFEQRYEKELKFSKLFNKKKSSNLENSLKSPA